MSTSPTNSAQSNFDLIHHLSGRNMYQRLGLKSNAVSQPEIEEGWRQRLQLLRDVLETGEIDQATFDQAIKLVDEAYQILGHGDSRRIYDVQLASQGRPAPNSVTISNGRVVSSAVEPEDRYVLEGIISEGPRAKLWIAKDRRFERQVVVKRIHASQLRTTELQQRFLDEANFYAASNATHLVKVLDFNPENYEVVLEWLPDSLQMLGERLRHKKSATFTFQNAREMLRQALYGLDVLHRRGWVHGRVCASHILLDDLGNAKLSITPGLRETSTLSVPGKEITHLAPEMLNPQIFGEVTSRADLYTLGFVILELLCKGDLRKRISPALQEVSAEQIHWFRWHASTSEHLPAIEQLLPECPADLLSVLSSMTRKRPDERPQDAQATLKLLEELSASGGNSVKVNSLHGSNLMDADASAFEDFGLPPRLPQVQFENKMLDWSGWLKEPLRNFKHLSRTHQMIIASCVVLVCGGLLLLSDTKPKSPSRDQVASSQSESDVRATMPSEPPQIPTDPVANEITMPTISEISSYDPTPSAFPAEDNPNLSKTTGNLSQTDSHCLVFVTALPGFRVDGIVGHAPTENDPAVWQLQPGEYVVNYSEITTGGERKALSRSIQIAAGDEFRRIEVGQLKPIVATSSSAVEQKPKELIDFRVDVPFAFISWKDLNSQEQERLRGIIQRLIDRASISITERRSDNISLATLPVEKRRDPRVSYLLAIEAYLLGKDDAAMTLCNESIKITEQDSLPFQLPYHLLMHLYAKKQGRSQEIMATSLRSLRQAERIHEQKQNAMSLALLAEELWFFGHVVQHISDLTTISSLDLNYWQMKGTAVESRFKILNQPIRQGRDAYLANLGSGFRSPLSFNPSLLGERVRQTLPPPQPDLESTVSR